jgi:hypothetical protein
VTVSKSEQLPEDGQVGLKHVTVECDFKLRRDCEPFYVALKTEVNE